MVTIVDSGVPELDSKSELNDWDVVSCHAASQHNSGNSSDRVSYLMRRRPSGTTFIDPKSAKIITF